MGATATATKSKAAAKVVELSTLAVDAAGKINAQLSLNGRTLVNNTGKPEFTPFSTVELPANSSGHVSTFTGNVLVKENKNGELMYFGFFMVEGYGSVLSSQKLDFINNLVPGGKYKLITAEPKGGYSVIKKIEKA
jgi:hypothetical protein